MIKSTKILIGVLSGVVVLAVIMYALFAMWWNGAFEKHEIRDIETYESPDGNYTLIFQQIGDPHWSFGPADVRLVLQDGEQKVIDSVDTDVANDGANAGSGNIKSVRWESDCVIIILQAEEMKDREVKLMFRQTAPTEYDL